MQTLKLSIISLVLFALSMPAIAESPLAITSTASATADGKTQIVLELTNAKAPDIEKVEVTCRVRSTEKYVVKTYMEDAKTTSVPTGQTVKVTFIWDNPDKLTYETQYDAVTRVNYVSENSHSWGFSAEWKN